MLVKLVDALTVCLAVAIVWAIPLAVLFVLLRYLVLTAINPGIEWP